MPYEYPKYPANIFTDTDFPAQEDDKNWSKAWLTNALKEELQAALTELGTNPKGSYASVKARLEGIAAGGHITIIPLSYYAIGQGTWKIYYDARLYLPWEFVNDTISDHDNVSWKITLPKGTYTLLVVGNTGPNMGIWKWYINTTLVATFDMYGVTAELNRRVYQTGINVPSSGIKDLKLEIDGKNPSSSNYYSSTIYIALWRTA
ncbi:hypothetical protein ES703_30978 [subsurface metagenome]